MIYPSSLIHINIISTTSYILPVGQLSIFFLNFYIFRAYTCVRNNCLHLVVGYIILGMLVYVDLYDPVFLHGKHLQYPFFSIHIRLRVVHLIIDSKYLTCSGFASIPFLSPLCSSLFYYAPIPSPKKRCRKVARIGIGPDPCTKDKIPI